ncbi:MAG: hypothetical protein KBT67_10475 [bacterium]|nr:hypothetical protein [Candidatus Limimorpha caballi]
MKKNTTLELAEGWRFFSKNPQGLALTGKLYELTLHYDFICYFFLEEAFLLFLFCRKFYVFRCSDFMKLHVTMTVVWVGGAGTVCVVFSRITRVDGDGGVGASA